MGYRIHDELEIVDGDYIRISRIESVDYCTDNPLDDNDYGGFIHGGFSSGYARSDRGSFGDKGDMREAIGASPGDIDENDWGDYMEQAVPLVILGLSDAEREDAIAEMLEHHLDLEEGDEPESPAWQLQTLMSFAYDWTRSSYKTSIPSFMSERIDDTAKALFERAVQLRVVGDPYAIPVNFTGYHDLTATPSPETDWLDHEIENSSNAVWVPKKLFREELAAMPYEAAMAQALKTATGDCELFSDWASGNIYDVDVKVFRVDCDEDGEAIEDADHYWDGDAGEAIAEESCGFVYGDDHAREMIKEFEGYVATKIASDREAQNNLATKKTAAASGMSASF